MHYLILYKYKERHSQNKLITSEYLHKNDVSKSSLGYLGGSWSGLTGGTWMRKRLIKTTADTKMSKTQSSFHKCANEGASTTAEHSRVNHWMIANNKAVIDIRLCPQCWNTQCGSLWANMTSFTKLEVHNVWQCCQKTIEPGPERTCIKI